MERTFGEDVTQAELVFVALPDDAAVERVPEYLRAGRRVVDLSAAFRLRDKALIRAGTATSIPRQRCWSRRSMGWLSGRATSSRRPTGRGPGCYPTAALLPLLPLLAANKIEPDVIVDAKSGVSGAGRTLRLSSHFSEVNEDVSAYGLGGHRHMPEIRQQLERVADSSVPADIHAASSADDARYPGDQLRDSAPRRDAR